LNADRALVTRSLGQVTAVSFASPWQLAIQEREPAAISIIDVRTGDLLHRIDLGQPSRYDTGHAMFHMRTNSGMACASCHAEAGDDAHVWTFNGIGPRRTQSLRGGILGTEPFHWNGDMPDFSKLVTEVMVGRMGSSAPPPDKTNALSHWIDAQPALSAQARDAVAAERGKVLFESPDVACASCHNGLHLTDNKSVDVGTGALLQVPSLRGVSFRTPLMHTGCAATLEGRFDAACGGSELHGHTSQLQPAQRADLISYLETL
jgi:mono/diheme cytochrome c family protein